MRNFTSNFKGKQQLVELGISLLLFAVIIGGVFFWLTRETDTTDRGRCHTNQRRIEASAIMYRARHDEWPEDIQTLVEKERLDEIPQCPADEEYEMVFFNDDLRVDCEVHGYYREANDEEQEEN